MLFRGPTVVCLEWATSSIVSSYGEGGGHGCTHFGWNAELVGTVETGNYLGLDAVGVIRNWCTWEGLHVMGRQAGWGGWSRGPSPGLIGWEVEHGVFWGVIIERSAFFGEYWAV